MSRVLSASIGLFLLVAGAAVAQPAASGPYRVIKTARVGGEGGWDYVFADVAARRVYIPRRGTAAVAATDTRPASPASPGRVTVFDLDTLAPIGQVDGITGAGAVIDPVSGNGFTSSRPVAMFDSRTLKTIKTIDVGGAQPDGILFDAFNERVYMFSHPTHDATVIDGKDGTVLGTIDVGGVPEQAVSDGNGMLYVSCRTRKAA